MKKTEIIKKNYEFKNILEKGKHYGGSQIIIVHLKTNKEKNYLGIAIGKKISNSVYRNKIKRLIKENYRLLEEDLKVGNCFVILWNKKCEEKEADFNTIKNDMKSIFKKIDVLKEDNDI